MFSVKNKVAIITGTSTGLGQGFAKAFVKAGAKVLGVSQDQSPDTQKELGKDFVGFAANLINQDKVEQIVQTAVQKFGRVDILINNAGIIRREDAVNFNEKDWDDVMNINSKTVFFLSQAVARQFIAQKPQGGKIINIASMLSYQGGIRVPSYTASKSAVKGLTMAMANEWAKFNINVNAIAPGYFETANTAPIRADKQRSDAILERIPAARWGQPDDLLGTAIYLASSASDYVNGFTVAVDGGWLAR